MDVKVAFSKEVAGKLPEWLDQCVDMLPPPERRPLKKGFRWRHPVESAEVVQVAKAARMVSGLRAARILVNAGHTTECGALLRMVSDFVAEIKFLGEGLLRGKLNTAQKKFVEQAFRSIPGSLEEWAKWEKEYYVGRKDIRSAHRRLMQDAGQDADLYDNATTWLSHGYDGYVHGNYDTAMELYNGRHRGFEVSGTSSVRLRRSAEDAIAWKIYEAITAFEMMALSRRVQPLYEDVKATRRTLEQTW